MTRDGESAPDRVAGVVEAVRSSRKYATVAEGVVRRLAAKALRDGTSPRGAQRAVRGKLHQVYAAYLAPGDLGRAERLLAALPERPAPEELAQAARRILARHASSAERLAFQEGLLARLLSAGGFAGPLRRVVDLGCGFHPLTLPWMGLPPE
ncbi:MAG: hypothetical protein FJY75_07030, partial [Candidatus Eisenbacteria bacterium]|nr:hypothetical protein [Candidatus Eisenbacteria bacterium]